MTTETMRPAHKTLIILGAAAYTLCLWASTCVTAGEEAIAAKVIETAGNVEVSVSGQSPSVVAPGDLIYEGQELKVHRGGIAILAMYDKTLRKFTGPSTVTIQREPEEVGTVLGNLTAAVADMLFTSKRPTSQAVMATRAAGDAADQMSLPILTQPALGENLATMPRQFRWRGIRGVPLYRITVYNATEMMWQATTPETEVRWSVRDCDFNTGQTYYWVVEALVGNTTLRSDAGDFTLLDKERVEELSRALSDVAASLTDPARSLALQARLCLDTQAYSKAYEVLGTAIETTPSPEAFALRAELNDALGFNEETVSDYRKAMDLYRAE
jgi:hypothetical protein